MRYLLLAAIMAGVALPAGAQPPEKTEPRVETQRYGLSPWWLSQPVLAATGSVEMMVTANEASFTVTFMTVGKTSAEAVREVSEKASTLGRTLLAPAGDRVEVQSQISITPLYEQYRDKDGNRIDNDQPDKIERYQANADLKVQIHDSALAESLYSAALAAQPTALSQVQFNLVQTQGLKADLYRQAVADARRRAILAAQAAGAKLGPVRMIDPTGRACDLDILVVDESRNGVMAAPAQRVPSPPSPAAADLAPGRLPVQPPRQSVNSQVCVVYGLS